MNNEEFVKELSIMFYNTWDKKELCRRIAEALSIQDSCAKCQVDNMRVVLQTGETGYLSCGSCTDEIMCVPEI